MKSQIKKVSSQNAVLYLLDKIQNNDQLSLSDVSLSTKELKNLI